ncbi:helix-turn-helix domain-containing protein [Yoonia sediminilitoris]|uniref:Helix-turn-helix protein n=1 Tax=Yoonia sediminilitoris TaxID=1286148 RepID=A0A2T6KB58_9RHOB|nr:helix-turn-helix domain-containing protein [Yoonia sediminilitoris]PUB12106.1 helix-turn-helix protein [Yoonia sediminilitoris]RCW92933.1 helix-turn-helix protein [Yoonia sediminilitoris]
MTDVVDWYSDDAATFGDRLAGARQDAGLTQQALSAKLGVKSATLAAWEDDLKEPRANRLQMLSGLLGVSLSWLLTGNGEGPTAPAESDPIPKDVTDILAEMRLLRTNISQSSEKLGQLEKRLRAALRDSA